MSGKEDRSGRRLAPITRAALRSLLEQEGLAPLHRLGQHFLVREDLLERIADLGEIAPGQVVLEVGPGLGGLTERLLARGARVVAAERDHAFAKLLPGILGRPAALHIVEGDVMASKSALAPEVLQRIRHLCAASDGECWKVVSNLPYQISSPFIAALPGLVPEGFRRAVLLVQKEVAGVLRAEPGAGDYSPLSFLARVYLEVRRGPAVPRSAFHPQPRVDSEVVILVAGKAAAPPPDVLLPFVRRLFQGRRKTLLRTLAAALPVAGVKEDLDLEERRALLASAGLDERDRIDRVDPFSIVKLLETIRRRGDTNAGS